MSAFIGIIAVMQTEGSALGWKGALVLSGRHCISLATPAQAKIMRHRNTSEKWQRDNLLHLAVPTEREDLRKAVFRDLPWGAEVKVTYRAEEPLSVLESIELAEEVKP